MPRHRTRILHPDPPARLGLLSAYFLHPSPSAPILAGSPCVLRLSCTVPSPGLSVRPPPRPAAGPGAGSGTSRTPSSLPIVSQNPSRWSNHGVSRRSTALAASSAPRLAALAGAASAFRPAFFRLATMASVTLSPTGLHAITVLRFSRPAVASGIAPAGIAFLGAATLFQPSFSSRIQASCVTPRAQCSIARVCCSTFSASRHGVIWIRTISRIQFQPVGQGRGSWGPFRTGRVRPVLPSFLSWNTCVRTSFP